MNTCGECEFFGDFDGYIFGPWEFTPGTKFYGRALLGFDEKKGAICALPRSGTKTRTYPDTTACPRFKPRTWTRPAKTGRWHTGKIYRFFERMLL